MKKILQLLGILTFVICNYGNAKELKCEYELKNFGTIYLNLVAFKNNTLCNKS